MESQEYQVEKEYCEGGSEAPDNFRAFLHGRFDVVVKCELQFSSIYDEPGKSDIQLNLQDQSQTCKIK